MGSVGDAETEREWLVCNALGWEQSGCLVNKAIVASAYGWVGQSLMYRCRSLRYELGGQWQVSRVVG